MRSQAVVLSNAENKAIYISKFCGKKYHPEVFPPDARCDIQVGPLEERCNTCGLITGQGWLTDHFEKQNNRIELVERKIEALGIAIKSILDWITQYEEDIKDDGK